MTGRDVLLIAHGSLHPALRRELAARGLVLRESARWQDADCSEPGRILGAYTWLYEGLRHPLTVWRMHRALRRNAIPLFVWNQDAPHYLNRAAWRLDWLDRARLFDIYATHTLVDARRQFADSLLYLANGADTRCYHLRDATLDSLRDPVRYDCDVSFFRRHGRQPPQGVLWATISSRAVAHAQAMFAGQIPNMPRPATLCWPPRQMLISSL